MPYTWNVVTRNLHGHELLGKKIREKITRLEKHLKHCPADAVHLHIALERNSRKERYTAALTLRVPSDILHSEKSANDVIKAFDDAIKALMRELESLKFDLRSERFWKRKERRDQLRQSKAAGFAAQPQAEGTGPQKYDDVVRDLLQQHYDELLRHARRLIHQDELADDLPQGAVDPRDVVDEVARRAEAKPTEKPKEMGWMVWFYHLVHEELKRQRRLLKRKKAEDISLDETKELPEDAERAAGYDAEQPLDIIEDELEPAIVRTEALVPDLQATPPERIVELKEFLRQLQSDMRNWSRPEREIFELYFVEGLEPEEIATVTGQPLKSVREFIAAIQQRARQQLLEQEAIA